MARGEGVSVTFRYTKDGKDGEMVYDGTNSVAEYQQAKRKFENLVGQVSTLSRFRVSFEKNGKVVDSFFKAATEFYGLPRSEAQELDEDNR